MYSLWFLLATLQAVTMYAVWRMGLSGSRKLCGSVPLVPPPSAPIGGVAESTTQWTRPMKWISIGKFTAVHTKCPDLIAVSLRSDAQWVSSPVPAAFRLPASRPSERTGERIGAASRG